MSKRGLGKGLDALLATSSIAREKQQLGAHSQQLSSDGELTELAINHLQSGVYQPRKDMDSDALEELSASIQSQGIIQPIVVRTLESGRYEIIAGERRWRAAKLAGLKRVPCVIKSVDDRSAIAMALIENIQRENLNSIEEAQALNRLQEEFHLTHQQIASVIGKSRATVSNLLRLNQLETEVKQLVEAKRLDMGHARALLMLSGERQINIAQQVADKQLTVRQTEQLVKSCLEPQKQEIIKVEPTTQSQHLSSQLATMLSAKVNVSVSQKGKASITINLDKAEMLESVLEKLTKK